MNEAFLHYIWKYRLLTNPNLLTTDGRVLQVIEPGVYNTDAGPDFFNARIKIGDHLWAGNVELHLKSSDWSHHNHHKDKSYQNIILHVVFQHDGYEIPGIPILELKNFLSETLIRNYSHLCLSPHDIPCLPLVSSVPDITLVTWLERMIIERLEQRSKQILDALNITRNDWQETLYSMLVRSFGFKTNGVPFELLAKCVPYSIVRHYVGENFKIEALLFGCSGLLQERDEYSNALMQEFLFLKTKHDLKVMNGSEWKLLRMRPSNFPTIRISQLAAVLNKRPNLLSAALETDIDNLTELLSVKASEYWDDHYNFGKPAGKKIKSLGITSAKSILINSIVPFLFVYGRSHRQEEVEQRSVRILEQLQPEANAIITKWKTYGIQAASASHTQGLLHLTEHYCQRKKCLQCAIGLRLINSSTVVN